MVLVLEEDDIGMKIEHNKANIFSITKARAWRIKGSVRENSRVWKCLFQRRIGMPSRKLVLDDTHHMSDRMPSTPFSFLWQTFIHHKFFLRRGRITGNTKEIHYGAQSPMKGFNGFGTEQSPVHYHAIAATHGQSSESTLRKKCNCS
ncbi:Uncharacterized protein Fot_11248 [Forsythia ovata]|uniref:Uncharacterized protein n=1 Tax=Forsythia ovata TaxID=205694 RepID=A0ABD1WJ61_9LAMI